MWKTLLSDLPSPVQECKDVASRELSACQEDVELVLSDFKAWNSFRAPILNASHTACSSCLSSEQATFFASSAKITAP